MSQFWLRLRLPVQTTAWEGGMDAMIAGLLLVTSTLGVAPTVDPVESRTRSAATLTLREAAARPNIRVVRQLAAEPARNERKPRFSKIERAIAIGAGTVIGFYSGALVGWTATDNPSNPNDDTSGLRGVVIGAPLGAVAGAVLGAVLTR